MFWSWRGVKVWFKAAQKCACAWLTLAKMAFTWRGTLRDACGQKKKWWKRQKINSKITKRVKKKKAVLQSRNQSPSGPGWTGTPPVVPGPPGWSTPVKPAGASLRPATDQACGDESDIVPVGQTWGQGPGRGGPQLRPPVERRAGAFRECRNFRQLYVHGG